MISKRIILRISAGICFYLHKYITFHIVLCNCSALFELHPMAPLRNKTVLLLCFTLMCLVQLLFQNLTLLNCELNMDMWMNMNMK